MKTTLSFIAMSLLLLAGCNTNRASWNGAVAACDTCAAKQGEALGWFKNLEGTWVSDEDGPMGGKMTINYHTISNGSAVCENLFPGSDHEMITMYHTHYGRMVATHYCAMGNQPRMIGSACLKSRRVSFDPVDATNVDITRDDYMGKMTYTFIDNDTFKATWCHMSGPVNKGSMQNTFRRKR